MNDAFVSVKLQLPPLLFSTPSSSRTPQLPPSSPRRLSLGHGLLSSSLSIPSPSTTHTQPLFPSPPLPTPTPQPSAQISNSLKPYSHQLTAPLRQPIYSEHIYGPTASTLSHINLPHLNTPSHQSLLLNAPLLECADSRRFLISQLPPIQQERYLSTFHAAHVSRVREAIEILEVYIRKHEVVDLRDYDFKGRVVRNEDGRCGSQVGQGTDDAGNAGNAKFSHNDGFSDATSDSEPNQEVNYDFASSLCSLSLDCENSLFGSNGIFEPSEADAEALGLLLSFTPTPTASIPSSPLVLPPTLPTLVSLPGALPSFSPPLRPSLPPPLSPATFFLPTTTATTQSSLLPLPTITTTKSSLLPPLPAPRTHTTHATLAIANLIHHQPPEDIIHTTSQSSTDALDEQDVAQLLFKIQPSSASIPSSNFYHPHNPGYQQQHQESRRKELALSSRPNKPASLLKQALLTRPVPLRQVRTMKVARMRRSSAERDGDGEKGGAGERQMSRKHRRSGSAPQGKGMGDKEQGQEQRGSASVDPKENVTGGMKMIREGEGEWEGDMGLRKGSPSLNSDSNTKLQVDNNERGRRERKRYRDGEYREDREFGLKPRSTWFIPPSMYTALTQPDLETDLEVELKREGIPQQRQQTTTTALKRKHRDTTTDDDDDEVENEEHPPSRRRITPYSWTRSPAGEFIGARG